MSADPKHIPWRGQKLTGVSDTRIWPSVGRRDDNQCLLYSGAINMLFGDSGSGKSWVALSIAKQECDAGHVVIYIDYESQAKSIKGRLQSIGMTDKAMDNFIYIEPPGQPLDITDLEWLDKVVDSYKPTLMVIDSAGESQALEANAGGNPSHAVTQWRKMLPERFAQLGLAVLEIDHTGVSWEASKRVEGTFRKKAGLTGVQLQTIEVKGQPHARGKEGHTKIICRKDREGTYANGDVAVIFVHKDQLDGSHGWVEFRTPTDADLAKPQAKEPVPMKCARAIQDSGIDTELSVRDIMAQLFGLGLTFSRDAVAKALKIIAEHGVLSDDEEDQTAA